MAIQLKLKVFSREIQLFNSLSFTEGNFARHAVGCWDLVVLLDFHILMFSFFKLPSSFLYILISYFLFLQNNKQTNHRADFMFYFSLMILAVILRMIDVRENFKKINVF